MLKQITTYKVQILMMFLMINTFLFSATNGTIKGSVNDAQTKEPLPYTNVLLKGTGLGAVTDFEGAFTVQNVPPGEYTLRVTFVGYRTKEISIKVNDGEISEYNFSLATESIEGETVVVTAQALGQKHAINEQLMSPTIKNVVSSAKIQELPDVNAAESVSRLPGVSLIRTGGEGSKVVVRGLSPQYNRITIDGVELPANSTSTNTGDYKTQFTEGDELSLSGDRGSDLSMISSNMLGGIEVIKAITPDMDATVFGGVVNFSMRKAQKTEFGLPKFELVTQGNHNGLKDTYNDYKFVGSYEQRFFDNSFGLFAQGTVEKKNLSSNELSANYNYTGTIFLAEKQKFDFNSFTLSDIFRDRRRTGATLVLDYAYETGSIGLMNFFSRSKTRSINRNEDLEAMRNWLYYSATNANSILDVYSNLLSIKQNIEDFTIDVKLSHSYSTSENPGDVTFRFWQEDAGFAGRQYSLGSMPVSKINSEMIHTPAVAHFFELSNVNNLSKDRTYNTAVDLGRDITISETITSKIKIGGAYQYRSRSYDYNQSSGSVFYDDGGEVVGAISRAFPQLTADDSVITYKDFIDPNYSYGKFLNGDYTLGPPTDVDLMLKVIEVANGHPGSDEAQSGYKPRRLASRLYDYSGNEKRSAGYAMITFNFGELFAVMPGVRYQNLSTTYTGLRVLQLSDGVDSSEATKTISHGYWLPMAHIQFKPLDWLQFHFAYTNTLNYADYNSIIPRYYIGPNFVLYNNYKLKPAISENYDVILSIYSNEVGLFTLGGFKKTIKDLIIPDKSYPKDFSAYPEIYDRVSKSQTELMQLITYVNNPYSIDVIGMETEWQTNFWYLPGALTGIVFNINYTHIFTEAKYPKTFIGSYLDSLFIQRTYAVDTFYTTRLLDQPKDVINISLGYDYSGFSVRASMLYKDNVFKNPQFWSENWVNSAKYVRYDLSAKQELPWYGIQIFLNLNNITGTDDKDIYPALGFPVSQQRYGTTVDLGLRIKL